MIYEKKGYLHDNFRVFHLKDKSDKEYNFHYHDFYKILIFISGNAEYSVEGRTYNLRPFDIILINAGEVHKPIVNGNETYERIIFYISPEYLNSFTNNEYNLCDCFNITSVKDSHVLRIPNFKKSNIFQTATNIVKISSENNYAMDLHINVLFLEFIIELNKSIIYDKTDYVENSSNNKIAAIIDYINDNLGKDLSIEHLSDKFYLSRYHLMHTFKSETGYSIGNYISTKRLLYAKELIQEGYTITDACYKCGFKNYSTFSRAYKNTFGTSARSFK